MTEALVQITEVEEKAPRKYLNDIWSPNIRDHFPFDVIRAAQEQGFKAIERAYTEGKKFIIIEAPTGAGKCFALGTKVLMFDGTTKAVENIVVGDEVMGDDSTPRKVLVLSQGRDEMYNIHPTKGESYCVNSQHVLSLKVTKGVKTTGSGHHNVQSKVPFYRLNQLVPTAGLKIDIPLKEYQGLSKTQKHTLKGYRVGVHFPEQHTPLAPYFLGLWLGDGTSSGTGITTADAEVINYVRGFAVEQRVSVTIEHKPDNLASTLNLVTPRGQTNPLLDTLRMLNVLNNKHIPQLYLSNSYENRLALLAGLIDSDGSRTHGSGFDFTFKNQLLAQGVTTLCRSLGMAAYMSPCEKTCVNNGVTGSYYRISVSGGDVMSYLPAQVKVARKRPTHRLQKKDVLVHGITVEPIGIGSYFGFEVDGNHRFLLADFTVVHNSGIAIAAGSHAKTQDIFGFEAGAYLLSPQKLLTAQYMGDFASMGLKELKGRSNYTCTEFENEEGESFDCEVGGTLCSKPKGNDEEDEEDEEELYPLKEDEEGSGGCSFCPYKEAKKAFVNNPLGVTNFSYYLNETTHAGQLLPRNMLILDEGHNTENCILSLADIIINYYRCEEVGIDFLSIPVVKPGQTTKGAEWIANEYRPAANSLIMKWESELKYLKAEGLTGPAGKLGKKLNSLKRFMSSINLFLNSVEENITDWIVYSDATKGSDSFGCLIIKPLTAKLFAHRYLFSKANKVIIMSATIGDFNFFMRNLDIDPNDAVTCRIPCDFPVETRRVYLKPIANMSSTKVGCPSCSTPENAGREGRSGSGCSKCYKSGQVPSIDVAMPKVAAFLDKILDKFSAQKGIVHTHSYKVTKFMAENLSLVNTARVVTHTSVKGNRDAATVKHIESEEPTVLMSPSMTEGLDLKDDLSRFSVLVKVPFAALDPYVMARKQRDSDWYSNLTAQAIVQAIGRSNRHKGDRAVHFILDSAILSFMARNAHLFPQWFMDAVVWPN